MMELYIETLTGTAFELQVSPFETIMSVKAKIQRLEGKTEDVLVEVFLVSHFLVSHRNEISNCCVPIASHVQDVIGSSMHYWFGV